MSRTALLGVLLVASAAGAAPARGVPPARAVAEGYALYGQNCASCHGSAGAGIAERAPSLRGVGARAADFYLRTGYMPLESPGDEPRRSRVLLSEHQLQALIAFVASLEPGPPVPTPHPERGDVSEGQSLFAANCAGCHQIVGVGGIATGARAPSLGAASAVQVAEAVRIGPYLMPRFGRTQISDVQLNSIIRYVQETQSPNDAGGWSIGHLGPIPEGIVAWLIAGVALVAVALLIGKRARA